MSLVVPLLLQTAVSSSSCNSTNFPIPLSSVQFVGAEFVANVTTAEDCLAHCCSLRAVGCTAWQYHVASTDPSHHPHQCWHSSEKNPPVGEKDLLDDWVGGALNMPELEPSSPPAPPTPPAPSPSPAPPGPDYRSGATIQPLSSWWYDAPTATSILLRELTDQSLRYLHNRSSAVSKLNETDVQGWSARIAQAQSNLGKVFAPLPPKSRNMRPMYKIVEVLTRPTYTCTKIMYQTRPGFHVPAALWKPANASVAKKAPGVLLVSGHTPDGFRSNNLFGDVKDNAPGDDDYEVVQINLVARGFVVLAFDPIGQGERMQYADTKQGAADPLAPWSKGAGDSAFLWSATQDHEYMGRQLLLNGIGLMSFWLHDETVSLDLLSSLEYVDSSNLGVVGCSGGGTQSSYLAAMDPRVKAASVACYISTFEIDRLWNAGGGSDGEQTWPHGVAKGLDKSDLLEVRANRSTQVLITSADTCFPAAGGRAAVAEATPAYKALGGVLENDEAVWHHGWVLPNRERITQFFCRHLKQGVGSGGMNDGHASCSNPTELDVSAQSLQYAEYNDNQLKVTTTGQVVTAPECRTASGAGPITVHNFTKDITLSNTDAVANLRAKNPNQFLESVRAEAPTLAGYHAPAPATKGSSRFLGAQFVHPHVPGPLHPNQPPMVEGGAVVPGLVERVLIPGEGVCMNVVTLFFPPSVTDIMTKRKAMPAVVWYQKDTIAADAPPIAALNLSANNHIVIFPELCGFGSVGPAFSAKLGGNGQAAEDMAHEIGRSIPGMHAGDVVRVNRYLNGRDDVQTVVAIVAEDFIDVAVMHAMIAEPEEVPPKMAFIAPAASLAAAASNRFYATDNYYSWIFGMLLRYDLADCVAAIASNAQHQSKVLIVGPVDEMHVPLPADAVTETYKFASTQAGGSLTVIPGDYSESEAAQEVLGWLANH